jgi:hypothetical protein
VKKPIDYINALCLDKKAERQKLGNELKIQYNKWTDTLKLEDFLSFSETIWKNRDKIGVAQFFGKFRAYAFEEFVYRLLWKKIHIPKPLRLFWGEKCFVWQKGGKEYVLEFDVSIGKKIDQLVEPVIVFDAKVELDSARLKTALASFAILKRWNPKAKCVLVYMIKDIDSALLELAADWMDAIFQFNIENDETKAFLNYIAKSISQY